MLRFLFIGLIRDRSRSLFPFLVVTAGVLLTVIMFSWINGVFDQMISSSANFNTGHVKIVTKAYADEIEQSSNDLALLEVNKIINSLEDDYPELNWNPRIKFACLIDIADEDGNTKEQGPAIGIALDLLSGNTKEIDRLNLNKSLIRGQLPSNNKEILLSENLAKNLKVKVGGSVTIISSTMFGSSVMENLTLSGTIQFGMTALDRATIIADLKTIQQLLDMEDGCSEILGYFNNGLYDEENVIQIQNRFEAVEVDTDDEFYPVMLRLTEQEGLEELLNMVDFFMSTILIVFVGVMSIVLWNTGLMGSLRRYGEIGVRLAIGENKKHLFLSTIGESMIIGIVGTLTGTILGLTVSYYLQIKGIDVQEMMKTSTVMMNNTLRAKVTIGSYFIGIIPGLAATILGTLFSGFGIFKRKTAQLFKELEV